MTLVDMLKMRDGYTRHVHLVMQIVTLDDAQTNVPTMIAAQLRVIVMRDRDIPRKAKGLAECNDILRNYPQKAQSTTDQEAQEKHGTSCSEWIAKNRLMRRIEPNS